MSAAIAEQDVEEAFAAPEADPAAEEDDELGESSFKTCLNLNAVALLPPGDAR